jgi:hypothetical protein
MYAIRPTFSAHLIVVGVITFVVFGEEVRFMKA